MKLSKIFYIFIVVLFSTIAGASDMDSFYQDPENERKFQRSQQSGMIDKVRESTLGICKNAEKNKPEKVAKSNCECMSAEIGKLTDREIFFETVSAYQHFQKMVEAKTAGNEKEYARLKKEKDQKKGFAQRVEQVCSQ